jgi:hypothetical protein
MARLYAAVLLTIGVSALLLSSCDFADREILGSASPTATSIGQEAGISFADLQAAGAELYGAVAEGRNVSGYLTEIFSIFGLPVLGLEEAAEIEARRVGNDPFVLDVQIDAMAKGYANGTLVTLDSFCAALANAGVQIRRPAGPLTCAYLTNAASPLVGKRAIEPGELLSALVLAIGHARANQFDRRRSNPLWGDDYLDPLQFVLLSYAFERIPVRARADVPGRNGRSTQSGIARTHQSDGRQLAHAGSGSAFRFLALSPAATDTGAGAYSRPGDRGVQRAQGHVGAALGATVGLVKTTNKWLSAELKLELLSWVNDELLERYGKGVEFPFSPSEGIDAIICGSVLLYSYRLDRLSGGPLRGRWRVVGAQDIWHRQSDRPDRPYQWEAEVRLLFDFVPSRVGKGVLRFMSCKALPEAGPVPNHPMEWRPDGALARHVLETQGITSLTDRDGVSVALFTAVDEKVPPERRKKVRTSQGLLTASARRLVPGYELLELAVRGVRSGAGVPLPIEAAQSITVNHFEPPRDFRIDFNDGIIEITGRKCDQPGGEWSYQEESRNSNGDWHKGATTFTLDETALKGSFHMRALTITGRGLHCPATVTADVAFEDDPDPRLRFTNVQWVLDDPRICGPGVLAPNGYALRLEEGEFCAAGTP